MDLILALHSHLPYVLHHGRWPHGSDWLCEATLDTYLPLLEALRALEREGVSAPITIGFTPVLANQLASSDFAAELEAFIALRLKACAEAPASLAASGDSHLRPLAEFWRARFTRLRDLFRALDGGLLPAFRALEEAGRIEIIGSAATHGYLPLLGRAESVALQLGLGAAEHRRFFGRAPRGCWLPECAYRPGLERQLARAGFRYFFTDAHLAVADPALGTYADAPLGAKRFDAKRTGKAGPRPSPALRTPYTAYQVSVAGGAPVFALVRDPRSSAQVWSRHEGYPGDKWYLDFHKIRQPGGLKYWRVSGPGVDMADKRPYEPEQARGRVLSHGTHFARHLASTPRGPRGEAPQVAVAPFDTELFGHWWFEGVDFLAELYRQVRKHPALHPRTAEAHLESHPNPPGLRLAEGSWGASGDHSMWLNKGTRWTWERLHPLEDAFWGVAASALARDEARPVLAQAARSLLLAQASDWQFIISTGAVVDYAERRFRLHCDDADRLVAALRPDARPEALARAREDANVIGRRDAVFPEILSAVSAALAVP